MAVKIHKDLAAVAPVSIEEPPPPPALEPPEATPPPIEPTPPQPPPVVETTPKAPVPPKSKPQKAKKQQKTAPSTKDTPPGEIAPPAESGRVIATEPAPEDPVDLTDDTIVMGTASAYVGGVSSNKGTNKVAVPEGATDENAAPTTNPGRPSRARAIQLAGGEWRCNWPSAAVNQDIYEQFVMLRVVVRQDGSLERAKVIEDPGHGFGEAAIACARRARFLPARNAAGTPIRATSPPIRVRFTR